MKKTGCGLIDWGSETRDYAVGRVSWFYWDGNLKVYCAGGQFKSSVMRVQVI
ncbi:MAG: hypothetical protein ACYSSL_03305 [Planctomycetota bacterium]